MKPYSEYHSTLVEETKKLSKIAKTIFLGQQCGTDTNYSLLCDVPAKQRLEVPVMEELQLGICIGLSLEGYLPICIYQRMDFIPRALDQIINHLNIFRDITQNIYHPKIIIFTTIGQIKAGIQHNKDLVEVMKVSCKFPVFHVKTIEEIKKAFLYAKNLTNSSMIIADQEKFYS